MSRHGVHRSPCAALIRHDWTLVAFRSSTLNASHLGKGNTELLEWVALASMRACTTATRSAPAGISHHSRWFINSPDRKTRDRENAGRRKRIYPSQLPPYSTLVAITGANTDMVRFLNRPLHFSGLVVERPIRR